MLSIKKNEINAEGSLHTQLVDFTMLADYITNEIEKEFGKRASKRFIKRLWKTIKRGKKKCQ